MRSSGRTVVAAAALTALTALPASAGDVSLRAGAYTDVSSAFVGIEYRAPVERHLFVAPNFEVAFPGEGSYFSFSADLHYLFPVHSQLTPWLGGGLGIYARNHEGGDHQTSVGLNLIGGLGLRTTLKPYMQLKVVVKGDTAVVLGFGIRF